MDNDFTTNILLVDDRPENLLALEAILEPLGQNLVKANSGHEALKCLLTSDFAVILLDVQMPDLDGFETAALIKERERTQHIPIIFLTAISKDEKYVFKGYTIGAVDYISKPFDPNILRSKVGVFVDLFRKTEQVKRQADLLRQIEQLEREREVAELKRASERRYRVLAESMPQIVWTADASGQLTYCNARWFDYTGLTQEETQRSGQKAAVHSEDVARFEELWGRAVAEGRDFEAEYRLQRSSDGCYRWHLERAVPVKDDRGVVASWIGTSTDIDDRRRAEDALRFLAEASTALASSLDYVATLSEVAKLAVPSLADWVLVDLVDNDSAIRRIVAAQADPSREGLAEELRSRFPVEPRGPFGPANVIATGQPELLREIPEALLVTMAHGPEHLEALRRMELVSYVCLPLRARGRTLGAITLARSAPGAPYSEVDQALGEDLARRAAIAVDNAELYAAAQRERAKLEEANRAKDEFLATLSHELRTPLNSMLGWTQLLRTGKLDEATFARALETIERNTKSQAQLIADLLDVSRIITGKLHLNIQPVDLGAVLDAAVDAVRPAINAKNIELVTIVDPAVGGLVGDPARLQQVVWNLLSNAIKFTSEEGRVEVRFGVKDNRAEISVTDTGQGIDSEFLPYVFDRFRQADSTSTRVHGGLGLGLAIVRHLTELHGGEALVESKGKGTGATFVVRLPLAQGPAGAEEGAAGRVATEPGMLECPPELDGLYVLVVEDEPDARDLLEAILTDCGAAVMAVSSADEAILAMGERAPDLVVSDIGLPGEDGYSLMRRIRALDPEHGGQAPAVALTAYASADDRARALSAGFQVHVAKPVEPNALTAVIANLTGRAVKS